MKEFSEIDRGDEPGKYRLLRICQAMALCMEAHPEFDQERAIIMIDSREQQMGGFMVYNYDNEDEEDTVNDREVIEDLVAQAKLLARGHGLDLYVTMVSLS